MRDVEMLVSPETGFCSSVWRQSCWIGVDGAALPDASLSLASMPKPKPRNASGLVSVNSTESATDGVENSEQEEEALEGMPVSMALILAAQALKGDIALDGTSVFSTGAGLRASSPEICTDSILDVLSAACLLEVALAPFERLSCSTRQSVRACSSSVACSSVALAFQY
jgi:hypothetical protein